MCILRTELRQVWRSDSPDVTARKVLTVVGTRPQFVKAAVVSGAFKAGATASSVEEVLVHTGQHYDYEMSGAFFDELGLDEPAYNLQVGSGSHARQTAAMLTALEEVIAGELPDLVLLYGDTNTTLAAALCAAKLQRPVAHVEAGLRCHDLSVPEEVNRVVTDRLSAILYTPSPAACEALTREAVPGEVVMVGDVMLDTFRQHQRRASAEVLERLSLEPRAFALATIHRAASADSKVTLSRLFEGLRRVAAGGLDVVLPLHPRTRSSLERWNIPAGGVTIIDPVGYAAMVVLESNARVVATDSGGVQKEAYWARVPCVTLRPATEWVETVQLGWNQLVDSDPDEIERAVLRAQAPDEHPDLYGDGHAADRIAAHLHERLTMGM